MSTEIKIWQISNNHITAVGETSLATEHLESELENWIVECPDVLGEDFLIIARQKSVEGVGRLDLLAIDSAGQLIVVELKRDLTPREAVAQALDYASWLAKQPESIILEMAQDYLGRPLEEVFVDRFGINEVPTINSQKHRILLVGARLDASSERIINYLAQSYGVNVNAIFFRYAKLASGQEILVRSVLVSESVIQASSVARRRTTITDLLGTATERQVLPLVEALRTLASGEEYVTEEATWSYGGSFRFWRRNLEGKSKMVLGVNVSGDRRATPAGQLDIWIPVATLAQVLGVTQPQAKQMLQKLPVLEMRTSDCIIRLNSKEAAESAAKQIKQWFDEYPGYYGKAVAASVA